MQNGTQPQLSSWRPEPSTRGTFSILSSCLITMTICVWTAVHLNIPAYGKSSQQVRRKAMWLIMALLAPELVALSAFTQHQYAGMVRQRAQAAFEQPEPRSRMHSMLSSLCCIVTLLVRIWRRLVYAIHSSSKSHREVAPVDKSESTVRQDPEDARHSQKPTNRHPWTQTHAYYAGMGGFAIDSRSSDRNFLPDNRQRMTLGSGAIFFILENDPSLFPDLAESEINDKSKASHLAKTLVCIQATWFCLQCFTRWGQHLSVSLLELNTLAHSLCALLMYWLWWDKPLDVEEPTLLQGEKIARIGALFTLPSSFRDPKVPGRSAVWKVAKGEDYIDLSTQEEPENAKDGRRILPGQVFHGFEFCGWSSSAKFALAPVRAGRIVNDFDPIHVGPEQAQRWELAGQALRDYGLHGDLNGQNTSFFTELLDLSSVFLFDRMPDFGGHEVLVPSRDKLAWTTSPLIRGIVVAGLIYGGIHLIAWNGGYHSKAEEWLWKFSALVIASSGFVMLFFSLVVDLCFKSEPDFWGAHVPVISKGIRRFVIVPLLVLYLLLYLFSRVFLVVESFIGLSYLPDSAFETPRWSRYFPHAS